MVTSVAAVNVTTINHPTCRPLILLRINQNPPLIPCSEHFHPTCLQRTQTTPPFIERVSTTAADGVPRGMADRTQTIDVYGSPMITSGGFRLTYGGEDSGIVTPCIPGDSTNLNIEAISRALTSANEVFRVTVEEDDPPFDGARRFAVYFHEPKIGLGVLSVAPEDEGCKWIQCSSEANDGCEGSSGVLINRDKSVFMHEGAIEVCRLRFEAAEIPGNAAGERQLKYLVSRNQAISLCLLVQNALFFNRYRSSSIQSTHGSLTILVIHGAFIIPSLPPPPRRCRFRWWFIFLRPFMSILLLVSLC